MSLSGGACGPRIGGAGVHACGGSPDPPFPPVLGGVSTMRRSSRTHSGRRRRRPQDWSPAPQAGITLIEVVIAVTLLSMLSIGMLATIRMGFDALHKTNSRLMENRRVAGAQRVLEQQLGGFMPVKALCVTATGAPPTPFVFFEGQPQSMRLVSTYSLQEAWRGQPRILELQVIPGDEGRGVRLIVNEIPYTGPQSAGQSCVSMAADPVSGQMMPQFGPIQASPQSFVLADKLAWCRFSYLEPAKPPDFDQWRTNWVLPRWPSGLRIEMAPLEDNPGRLRPLTITAAIPINRLPDLNYVDH
jgi:type II secretory pathway pseudopilin PulG